ncbi:MAG TPA: 23S rRNA (adenine(1618)-N(6))-methyltransferase RlmF [Bacteroidales bacterium]|nr:23S rRNA (adenine(1618)-N(6))-methyltransferase RlmF [Bacteroidales bacterium]
MHPRNKQINGYNFAELIAALPSLTAFVIKNKYNTETIDFADSNAVKALNTALLKCNYGIGSWEIPEGYLCPPIPGRADYIHYIADLLQGSNYGKLPKGEQIKCLDIGVGASCIYPIIGKSEYGWQWVGTDIDSVAIDSATKIVAENSSLVSAIDIRLQQQVRDIFYGVLKPNELFDFTVCNPPFHASETEAKAGTLRKLNNLNEAKTGKVYRNFEGQSNELWCDGGERKFVLNMIRQSKNFGKTCFWFTTLISKQTNLEAVYEALKVADAAEVKTIPMGQGNKISRIVAWTFLNAEERKIWREKRWK